MSAMGGKQALAVRTISGPCGEVALVSGIALLIVSFGLAAFMVNRLYVGLRDRELNVRGWVYSREKTPAKYWFTLAMATLALLFGVLLLVVAIAGVTGTIR